MHKALQTLDYRHVIAVLKLQSSPAVVLVIYTHYIISEYSKFSRCLFFLKSKEKNFLLT